MTNLLITLMLALGASYNYWEESEVVGRLKAHVGEITLAQNEGRSPGSEGEKAAAEYLYNALLAKGVDMLYGPEGDRFGVVSPSSDTLQSRNVVGLIQGYDPQLRDHYIIIGARMDNIGMNYMTVDGRQVEQVYAGANGNASGMALMAELAGMLSTGSLMLRRSVILVGFGSSTASFAGSWHFLKHSFAKDVPNIDAMVNLDMLGLGRNGLQAFTSGNDDLNLLLGINDSPRHGFETVFSSSLSFPDCVISAISASDISTVFLQLMQTEAQKIQPRIPASLFLIDFFIRLKKTPRKNS